MDLLSDIDFLTKKIEVKKKKPIKSEEKVESEIEDHLNSTFKSLKIKGANAEELIDFFRFKDKINVDILALAYIFQDKSYDEIYGKNEDEILENISLANNLSSFKKENKDKRKTILTKEEYEKKSKKTKDTKKKKSVEKEEELSTNEVLWDDVVMDIIRYINVIKKKK